VIPQHAARISVFDFEVLEVCGGSMAENLAVSPLNYVLLKAASRRWKRRTFAGKIDVAEKLFYAELDAGFWATIKAGNNLRNAVAHGHKDGTITQRTAELKKALLAWVSPEQRPGIEGMTEPQMISTAFNQCSSCLVVAADRYGK
jgi:hypothetical protein